MTQNNTIELWLVDLAKERDTRLKPSSVRVPRLTADDLERADAITDRRERRDRMAAYTALRVLLERIAGSGVRGRPFVRRQAASRGLVSARPSSAFLTSKGWR